MARSTKPFVHRPKRRWTLGLVVPLLLVAACQPVPHPTYEVVDAATTVRVLGLSGDGNYAVVEAGASSASVPGPGLWRVDRRDGSTTELPAGDTFVRISADGQRVLLLTATGGQRVWRDGAYLTGYPNGVPVSEDLTFAIYLGIFDPRVFRHDLSTGTRTPITIPDAAWNTLSISDDGEIVWYRTQPGGTCHMHFLEVATGAVTEHDQCPRYVSASGRYVLKELDRVFVDVGDGATYPRRLQLVATDDPGVVLAEASAPDQTVYTEIHLSATAAVFWTAAVAAMGHPGGTCGTPSTPPCEFSEETVDLVVGTPERVDHLEVDPQFATVIPRQPYRSEITRNGRFLVYASESGAVHVHDRIGGRHETLVGDGDPQGTPSVSDDGRVIVVGKGPNDQTGQGWYEHLAEDPAPPAP